MKTSMIFVLSAVACMGGRAHAQFTDWTSIGATSASGNLGGVSVTFSGPSGFDFGSWVLNDTSDQFNRTYFTPQLATSDRMVVSGTTTSPMYSVAFAQPVTNPVIHLSSLASVLTFDPGTSISVVSGQSTLIASGNTVSGSLLDADPPWRDSNGTVMLLGTFTSFNFSATFSIPGVDSVFMQVGGTVPSPGMPCMMGLGGLLAMRRRRLAPNA